MSVVEVVALVVAVLVAGALLLGAGRGGGTVGPRSVRGRLRDRGEGHAIERDHDPAYYSPRGGHRPDPPGMRKPPNEGGLL